MKYILKVLKYLMNKIMSSSTNLRIIEKPVRMYPTGLTTITYFRLL